MGEDKRSHDGPDNPRSPYWRGRPVIDWSPTPWDPAAERVLTQAARITAVIVVGQRRIPTADEVQGILALGDGTVESGSGTRALVEAVVSARFWGPPATDPGWILDPTRPRSVRIRNIRAAGLFPPVVIRHPAEGWRFAAWSGRPYGTGRWAWNDLNMYGLSVVRSRELKPWKHPVRGSLVLATCGSEVARRLLPEHIRSAESTIRSEVVHNRGYAMIQRVKRLEL